jgi:hypothetical protein
MTQVKIVVGVAWYGPKEWARMKELCVDPEAMDDSYAVWLSAANRSIKELRRRGQRIEKVLVDPDEFAAWCATNGERRDAGAWASFATVLLRRKHERP